jgi:Domain of unknown function (DUF6969)
VRAKLVIQGGFSRLWPCCEPHHCGHATGCRTHPTRTLTLDSSSTRSLPSLARRTAPELLRSLEAARTVRASLDGLRAGGRSVLERVLNGKPVVPWEMYPWQGGVVDERTHSQYFYHVHPGEPGGHFHLFSLSGGRLAHLVAVSMDARGQPVALFTVNRWVTDDTVLPAGELARLLPQFRVGSDAFDREVSGFLGWVVRAFEAEIVTLIEARERAFEDYRAAHGGEPPYEDRRLEVTSTREIDLDAHIVQLEAALRAASNP